LTVSVQSKEGLSLDEIRAFLKGSGEINFEGENREEIYRWVNETLRHHRYEELGRTSRGVMRRYIEKMTGMSRAQTTRFITQYLGGEEIKPRQYRRRRFPIRYTRADVQLLAQVDEANSTLSGPATQKILQRAWYDFGDQQYQRLATLSVAHLYRLRKSPVYRKQYLVYQPTRPVQIAIGERRAPQPEGRAGFLRVDTVHQGDLDGVKGIYYINAVDEVTQWQVIGATPLISEGTLLPVLEQMLRQFPFKIRGFHSDNGSEYINYSMAGLLKRLLIEQTKSRPRHCNDNALAETKNGAVVRKHMGYQHIAALHAPAIGKFLDDHLNPYLNFHRPCAVAETVITNKGRIKKKYPWFATPWQILRQLPDLARQLKTDVTIAGLDQQARSTTDMQAAQQMQRAKCQLLAAIHGDRRASKGPWK
jgi:hypothetical protein